ncbi:MAG TPA: hypothetical protein PKC87_03780, partial [Candidatus Absconditabacterales bacterium]|nr:hypothetical protein [Candidatus Absconditabacterales bacterium]
MDYTYAMDIKMISQHKEIGLVVGSETSTIGKAAEHALLKNFNIIKTSKEKKEGERIYLDITDTKSITGFIQDFLQKYPGKKIQVL